MSSNCDPAPRTRPNRLTAAALACAVVLFGSVVLIQRQLEQVRAGRRMLGAADELMYFPSGGLLSQLAGAYRGIIADYAWLLVAQYSGAHLGLAEQQENYAWLGHAIRVIGDLDPKFVTPYIFGAQTLAWNAERPQDAIELLRVGMARNQMEPELAFQAGFVAYEKMRDYDQAGYYFDRSALYPDARPTTIRMAAAAHRKAGNLDLTRSIWFDIWQTHPNARLKQIARRQLLELLRAELQQMNNAADSFERQFGRPPRALPELVDQGYLTEVHMEPFGGTYELRDGNVVSSNVTYVRAAVRHLQGLADRYRSQRRKLPLQVEDLVSAGLLDRIPPEPFGGSFVIENGRVRTTTPLP